MNSVFQDYSNYYDLLNSGKDYGRETDYVLSLARRYNTMGQLQHILNLGCGTGGHDLHLARQGLQVTGVDRSANMLAIAKRRAQLDATQPPPLFLPGDITTLDLPQTFDLGLALFHVMSYQTTNTDLQAAMKSVAAHLRPGGLFIFDFWYGPAVLHEKPLVRVKRVEDDHYRIQRLTEPVLRENANTVEVNFEVAITAKSDASLRTLHETHTMRYLFLPEVKALLAQTGFTLLCAEEWLSGHPPSINTWNVCCVARKMLL